MFCRSFSFHLSVLVCRPTCRKISTIFALSSGYGKCGVSVIRVSGPASKEVTIQLLGKDQLPSPRVAHLNTLYDPKSHDPIDKALVLWFPGPHSFTGEDVAELHVHGGAAVLAAMFAALSSVKGLRQAEAGEFTKRAFFNGKLDLTEVEGLGDLIHAETEGQRKQALRQMEGTLSKVYRRWMDTLVKCVAHTEAVIDFGEEENIEDGLLSDVERKVKSLVREVSEHLKDGRRGERLRNGVHVAILGPPNAGKSSLLNILCQRPAAIVSPYAGTTRDVVTSTLDIGGYPVVLSDTAGLRKAEDPVEEEGVRRAVANARTADLRIYVNDLTQSSTIHSLTKKDSSMHNFMDVTMLEQIKADKEERDELLTADNTIIVMNKVDLVDENHMDTLRFMDRDGLKICWLSCKTEEGVKNFLNVLQAKLAELCGTPGVGNPSWTQQRHNVQLTHCLQSLLQFLNLCKHDDQIVFAAEELRYALKALGRITGSVGVEEVLDVIFRDFCIGK